MTLAEIKASEAVWLTPDQVAPVLHCNPHLIRLMARDDPKLLGFPVMVIGSRTRIPRKPFLAFLGEGPPEGMGDGPHPALQATFPKGEGKDGNTPIREEGGVKG